MPLHVLFTEDGIPGWIGQHPIDGSEELPEILIVNGIEIPTSVKFLSEHQRTPEGEWILRPPPAPPSAEDIARQQAALLERHRASARERVDGMIYEARLRFVTPLPGQDAIYLAKEAEAKVYLAADPAPADLSAFPYLAAEVGITAPTALDLARIWAFQGAQFRQLGAFTEHLRMSTKKNLMEAADIESIDAIMNGLTQNLSSMG